MHAEEHLALVKSLEHGHHETDVPKCFEHDVALILDVLPMRYCFGSRNMNFLLVMVCLRMRQAGD